MDKAAAFGPRLTSEGLVGTMSPPPAPYTNGCIPFSRPIVPDNWVALVERGSCSFLDKVRALQNSGAVAVIIGDRHYNGWVTMYAAGYASDILIPSVYVTQQQFLALLSYNNEGVPVKLTSNGSWNWSMADILLFLAILIPSIILYAMYLTWRVSQQRWNQQRHQQQQQQQQQQQRQPTAILFPNGDRLSSNSNNSSASRSKAPAHVVHSLTLRVYHHDKKEKQEVTECIICLEEYEEGDSMRILPCGHEFHQTCVDAWLITRKKFVCI